MRNVLDIVLDGLNALSLMDNEPFDFENDVIKITDYKDDEKDINKFIQDTKNMKSLYDEYRLKYTNYMAFHTKNKIYFFGYYFYMGKYELKFWDLYTNNIIIEVIK